MKKMAPLLVLLASILWGAMGIVTRYVAELGFTTRQTAAVRICSAALALVFIRVITDRKKLRIDRKDLKWFFGTGLGSLFVNNLAYAQTVQRASLSVAVVLLYTAPLFVMILSVIFFKERLTARKIGALILAFAGCVLVVGLSDASMKSPVWLTLLIGLGAGFGYSLYSIFGKVLMGKYESLTVTVYTFLFASGATLFISEPVSMMHRIRAQIGAMPFVVMGSVLTLAIPYVLYSQALKYMESSSASIIASFEVVAASLFGVILYQEKMDGYNILGVLLVTAALVLLQIKRDGKIFGNISTNT